MLLIFDCDGVLIDSEILALDVLSDLMTSYGHPMSVEACQDAFMGLHNDDIVRAMERRIGRALPDGEGQRMREIMLARMERELKPVPGVAETLQSLEMPRCVASSSDHERIKSTLTWTGLDGFFGSAIFSGYDVPRGKPAPDLFLHAAEIMGVAPRDCVVVEDAPAGIQAAVAAGMRPIGFTGASHTNAGHRTRLETAGAKTIIADMRELPACLAVADVV